MLQNFYITFGSDRAFPFQNTFIIIRSTDEISARKLFPKIYPGRNGSDTLNFSFIYDEREWFGSDGRAPIKSYYNNPPKVIITDLTNDDYQLTEVDDSTTSPFEEAIW